MFFVPAHPSCLAKNLCDDDSDLFGDRAMSTEAIVCNACQRKFAWKAELAGKRVKCKCGNAIAVPARGAASRPPKPVSAGLSLSPPPKTASVVSAPPKPAKARPTAPVAAKPMPVMAAAVAEPADLDDLYA